MPHGAQGRPLRAVFALFSRCFRTPSPCSLAPAPPAHVTTALWDFGTYVNGGVPDPTWNEIDMIFRMGMEPPAQASVTTLANGTNVTGRYVSSQMDTTFFNPGEHKESFDQNTAPRFDGYIARQYHNFTITWTPDYIAWQLDEVVFRNVNKAGRSASKMRPPWRPQSIRLIFHTGNGSLHPLPAAHVYIKRLAYQPLELPPLLSTRSGIAFVVSTATWLVVYVMGMLMLGAGVRAVANSRHYQIIQWGGGAVEAPAAADGLAGPPGGRLGGAGGGVPLAAGLGGPPAKMLNGFASTLGGGGGGGGADAAARAPLLGGGGTGAGRGGRVLASYASAHAQPPKPAAGGVRFGL